MKKYLLIAIYCLFSSSLFAQAIPEDHLILHFNFDNNQLEDVSPRGQGFIDHNLDFSEGIENSGLLLNGTDAFLEIPHSDKLEVSNTLTTSIWYLHEEQATSAFYSLVEQSADEAGGHSRYGTWVFDKRKVLTCVEPDFCENGNMFCQRCITASDLLEEGKWYHIAATYSGDTLRVFIDGKISGQRFFTSSTGISTRPYPLTIGTDMYDPAPVYLKGTVDDVRIYDVDFSKSQVEELFKEFNISTSIKEVAILSFNIFPNPTTNFIQLQTTEIDGNYRITNAQGQLLEKGVLNRDKQIDIRFLSEGLYFIQYTNGVRSGTKSFVVNRNK